MQAAPHEIPSSSQQLKLLEPCPSFASGHSSVAPAALTVVMKRKFHEVLHAYKLHLLKFRFQYNC